MDKELLFKHLKGKKKAVLFELLKSAFDEMKTNQKYSVFGDAMKDAKPLKVDGSQILKKVRQFYKDSLDRRYYAPFDINSKNFSNIPEETKEWFEVLNDFLLNSTQLSQASNHLAAIECFSILYELIKRMEDGDEIIFADEYGSWMIPADESVNLNAYISSLAATKTPEEYARFTVPLIRRDRYMSSTNKVRTTAIQAGNREQREYLEAALKREKDKTE